MKHTWYISAVFRCPPPPRKHVFYDPETDNQEIENSRPGFSLNTFFMLPQGRKLTMETPLCNIEINRRGKLKLTFQLDLALLQDALQAETFVSVFFLPRSNMI